jgi:phospholipid/cholesterol/gamma-HCH transport system permease protein
MNTFVERWIFGGLAGLGQIAGLAGETVASMLRFKFSFRDLTYQIYSIGVKSQSVTLVTGAFTGMVMAAQTYYQFHKVKMDTATLAVVSVSMCSELGPVLTALMVAGRVGASMAAEIGTMRVTEQIDALRTLATHPVDFFFFFLLSAALISLPLLTTESMAIGIGSGYLVSVFLLGIDPAYVWWNMVKYSHDIDVQIGIIKSVVYGGIIALVGCFKDLNCGLGS